MPRFLEAKLKKEYPNDKAAPYKIMNAMGAMKGNKTTPKGEAMERKHKIHVEGMSEHTMTTVPTSSVSYFPGDEVQGSMWSRLPGRDNTEPSETKIKKPVEKSYEDNQP